MAFAHHLGTDWEAIDEQSGNSAAIAINRVTLNAYLSTHHHLPEVDSGSNGGVNGDHWPC